MQSYNSYKSLLLESQRILLNEAEGGFRLNVATLPFDKALEYTQGVFEQFHKDLNKEIPNFEKNYALLQKKLRMAIDIPRIDMPVIEPEDMKKFQDDLKKGTLDIFRPNADIGKFKANQFPKNLKGGTEDAETWLQLGKKDGKETDDKISATLKNIAAEKLLPTQSQIWLEKVAMNLAKFGAPKSNSPVLKTTIIVSSDMYILDGHHRFAQVMIADPSLKMESLYVPLKIAILVKLGRTYGNAIGNDQKG